MLRLRSILFVALAVLAFGWARPVSAQMTVTGIVAQSSGTVRSNLQVFITPRSTLQYVAPWLVTSETISRRTDGNGFFSVPLLRGNYSARLGSITNDWLEFTVHENTGTNSIYDLATSTNLVFVATNFMGGASALTNGRPGIVPQPLAGDQNKFLRGDGTWAAGAGGGGVTAHNELTGLDADDHPQYQLRSQMGASNAVAVATANAYTLAATNSLASWISANFQLATAFITEWSALDPDDYSTTAEANAAYQPLGTYASTNTFGGATSGSSGSVGLVPRPVAGDEGKFLRGDGSWASGGGGGVTDHGDLTGLADDDHPQYLLRNQTNLVQQLALDYTDAEISALSSVYQPLDADLTAWAAVNPSAYLTTSAAASSYQPLDTDLTAWAAVNPSSYSTTAQIAAGYQPLDADLTAWAAVNPSAYLTTASAASSYQPLDSDLTAWAAVNPSAYLTTSSAAATYQPIGTYATPGDIAAATNRNHLRVTNNLATQVQVITAASNATNYLLNAAIRSQLIDVTGNVRFVGLVGGLTGYDQPVSIMLSNGTGSAYTVEFTNTFKALRGHTNTIPANGVSWVGAVVRGDRVSYGAVPEQ